MVRSALGKVAWMARATTTVVGLAIMLALVLGVATTAMGANGQSFLLGRFNAATALTKLTGNVNGAAMQVANPNTGTNDTALSLSVQAGEAPMRVNSAKKVANLNADRIDDREASSFANGVGGVATNADKLDGKDSRQILPLIRAQTDSDPNTATPVAQPPFDSVVNKVNIAAPTDGFFVITGMVQLVNTSGYTDQGMYTKVRVDEQNTPGVSYNVLGTTIADTNEMVAVNVTVPVSAGQHTVDLYGESSTSWSFKRNNLNVMFFPAERGGVTNAGS